MNTTKNTGKTEGFSAQSLSGLESILNREEEIRILKQQIDDLQEMRCFNVANLLIEELERLLK
jgi:hypothetical protein